MFKNGLTMYLTIVPWMAVTILSTSALQYELYPNFNSERFLLTQGNNVVFIAAKSNSPLWSHKLRHGSNVAESKSNHEENVYRLQHFYSKLSCQKKTHDTQLAFYCFYLWTWHQNIF